MSEFAGTLEYVIDVLLVPLSILGYVREAISSTKGKKALLPSPVLLGFAACAAIAIISTNYLNRGHGAQSLKFTEFLLLTPGLAALFTHWENSFESVSKAVIITAFALPASLLFLSLARVTETSADGSEFIAGLHKNASSDLIQFSYLAFLGIARRRGALLLIAAAALNFSAVIYIGGRSALVVMAIFSVFVAIRHYRSNWLSLTAAGAILTAAAIVSLERGLEISIFARFDELRSISDYRTDPNSASSRLLLWEMAIEYFRSSPWIGIGFGNFRVEGIDSWLVGRTEPHNGLLQILCAGGILTFTPVVALIVYGALSGRESPYAMPVVGYLVSNLVGIYWIGGSGHLFWIFFYMMQCAVPRDEPAGSMGYQDSLALQSV